MPHKPENPGTCAYYGETIPKRSVLFDKLPEMVALSERRSRRDVKSVWTANTAKGIGPRTPRKGLDREHRERARRTRRGSCFSRCFALFAFQCSSFGDEP